jgi:hypothetical protein
VRQDAAAAQGLRAGERAARRRSSIWQQRQHRPELGGNSSCEQPFRSGHVCAAPTDADRPYLATPKINIRQNFQIITPFTRINHDTDERFTRRFVNNPCCLGLAVFRIIFPARNSCIEHRQHSRAAMKKPPATGRGQRFQVAQSGLRAALLGVLRGGRAAGDHLGAAGSARPRHSRLAIARLLKSGVHPATGFGRCGHNMLLRSC